VQHSRRCLETSPEKWSVKRHCVMQGQHLGSVVRAIQSAKFLREAQKRGILRDNAIRPRAMVSFLSKVLDSSLDLTAGASHSTEYPVIFHYVALISGGAVVVAVTSGCSSL
jgi:hypothetical protein